MKTPRKTLSAGLGTAALALLLAGPASATPGTGVQVETLSKNTVNGVDYIVTQITVAPGGGTGWHYHPGEVFGFIKEGTMTHYGPNCLVDDVFATTRVAIHASFCRARFEWIAGILIERNEERARLCNGRHDHGNQYEKAEANAAKRQHFNLPRFCRHFSALQAWSTATK